MKILVSILSQYIIPNFLVAKELTGKYDKQIFISTKEMKAQDKGLFLEKALGIEEHSIPRILAVEDDFHSIINSLVNKCVRDADDEYIVNLTGGTKIMALAVHEFFNKFQSTQFVYVPFEKNTICNLKTSESISLSYRTTLKEYFLLNGLEIEEDRALQPRELSYSIFDLCKSRNFSSKVMSYLRSSECNIENATHQYLSGKWFEEYIYYRLIDELGLDKEYIATGVKVSNVNKKSPWNNYNDNEADVVFVKHNKLYIIECKVTMLGPATISKTGFAVPPSVKETTEKYLYKLAAIVKDYGFKVNSYLFTLHRLKNAKGIEHIDYRRKLLGVSGIYDCDYFANQQQIFEL